MKKALAKVLAELKSAPRDMRLLMKAGEVAEELGDSAGACVYFFGVAKLHAAEGHPLKAIAMAKRCERLDPENGDVIQALVDWHERARYPDLAAEWRLKLPGG